MVGDLCRVDPNARNFNPAKIDLVFPTSTIIFRATDPNPERRLEDELRAVDRRTPGPTAFRINGWQQNSSEFFDRRARRIISGGKGPGGGRCSQSRSLACITPRKQGGCSLRFLASQARFSVFELDHQAGVGIHQHRDRRQASIGHLTQNRCFGLLNHLLSRSILRIGLKASNRVRKRAPWPRNGDRSRQNHGRSNDQAESSSHRICALYLREA